MGLAANQIHVPDRQSMDSAITSYIAQGFLIQNRGEDFAVLFKKKEFSVLWAVVGLAVCVLPLLVYLIVYATQNDQLVEIRVGSPALLQQLGASVDPALQWSDDGEYWWDGTDWRSVRLGLPPHAQISPDGVYFYDGTQWRSVPAQLSAGGPVSTARSRKVIEIEAGDDHMSA